MFLVCSYIIFVYSKFINKSALIGNYEICNYLIPENGIKLRNSVRDCIYKFYYNFTFESIIEVIVLTPLYKYLN